jgi:hypothetical protein
MQSIALRLADCGLMMHPEKSRVVYCKGGHRTASYPHTHFTFLGFTFSTEESAGPSEEGIYKLPSGGECRCVEAHAEGGPELAHLPSGIGNTRGSGAAIQSPDTRLVELLRGILSTGDAYALSIHRSEAYAVG